MKKEILHLGYHYLHNPGENKPGISMEISRFKAQLKRIRDNNYTVLSLSEVVERMKNKKPLPQKLATLSFDDGLSDGYTQALPILKQYGFPATFFIITGTLQRRIPPVIAFQLLIKHWGAQRIESEILSKALKGMSYETLLNPDFYKMPEGVYGAEASEVRRIKWIFNCFLPTSLKTDLTQEMFEMTFGRGAEEKLCQEMFISKEGIIEMSKAGMDFGSHSVTHPFLGICGLKEVKEEVRVSKKELERTLNKPVTIFGWPFGGNFKQRVIEIVANYYNGAYNFVAGEMPAGPYNIYDIPRINAVDVKV